MTGAQFYQNLSEAGKRMVWMVDDNGHIRGKFRKAKVKRCFCPVTAVYYLIKRKYYAEYSYISAAEDLNLNRVFTSRIVYAADNYGSKKVRRHLKKVLNIK